MGFNDQASFAGTVTRGTATGPGAVLSATAISVGGFDFTNPTGAAGQVTLRDGTQTNVLMTANVPANATRSIPGAHFADGLSISSPVAIEYAIPIFEPPSVKTAWTVPSTATLANSTLSTQFLNAGGGGARQRLEGPTDTAIFTSAPIGDFGVSFWYECDATQPQFHGPIGSAPNSALQDGWGFYRDTTDNEGRIYIDAFNTSFFQFTYTDLFTVSGWHNFIFTFDATNRQVTTWFDGSMQQSAINAISATRGLGNAVSFGASDSGGGTSTDFEGKVDVAAFWQGTIITDAQAQDLYNSGVPVVPSSIIAGPDWELLFGEDPSDDISIGTGQVTDQSGNGNHFTPEASDNIPAMNFNASVP